MRRIMISIVASICAVSLGACSIGMCQAGATATAEATLTAQATTDAQATADAQTTAEAPVTDAQWQGDEFTFTDDIGNAVKVKTFKSVAACMGSFAQVWTLAGGTLTAATEDAFSDDSLKLTDAVQNLGGLMTPNAELIINSKPDFVILSSNISGQTDMGETLTNADIPHAYFNVETFKDYMRMLRVLTLLTGREDLYKQNGTDVADKISGIIASTAEIPKYKVLFLRAYSSGVKAKGANSMTGAMLADFGCVNVADENKSLLEDLSLEKILEEDPDFIFVTTMGASDQDALDTMKQEYTSNPAWATLTAVKNDRFIVLPKNLFHLKPNNHWDESYQTLADIFLKAQK